MTTQNLEGMDDIIAAQAERTAQWRQRAANLLRDREQLDADTSAALANARMVERGIRQHFDDKRAPIDHEIEQVVFIVSGPQDVIDTEPPAQPTEPVVAVVTPEPPAQPVADEPPTAPIPTATEPPVSANAPVAYVRWVRSWRLLEWVLALLLAIIAFKISGDHQNFGFRTGFWSSVQHLLWRSGWTLIGFSVGGAIGSWLRPRFDVIIAEGRAART